MRNGESYQCCNCWNIAVLDVHGRCGRCGSAAVISQELVERVEQEDEFEIEERRAG